MNVRTFLPLCAVLGLGLAATPLAAEGLPPFAATDLADHTVDFTARSHGEPALIITGFTKASSDDCQAWEDRLWTAHAGDKRCRIFSILQLEGVPPFVTPFIKHSVRGKTPQERWGCVFLADTGKAAWEKSMDFSKTAPDDAYLAVVDASGSVRWKKHGSLTSTLQADLETALKQVEASPGDADPGMQTVKAP